MSCIQNLNIWAEYPALRAASVFVTASILLAACGSPSEGPASNAASQSTAEKADLTITYDGTQHACIVALASETQGSTIPCKEALTFARDELRVAIGSSYDLRMRGADEAEIASLSTSLKDAGYKPVGRPNAGPK